MNGASPPSAPTALLPSVEPVPVSPASPLRSHGAGVLPMAKRFGDMLGGAPWVRDIEQPQPATPPMRVGRADVWPPEVLEEIRRIYAGEEL